MEKLLAGSVNQLATDVSRVANAITPIGVGSCKDATGGTVMSLTEAVVGMTAGLVRIADAIEALAGAISERESEHAD